MRYNRRARLCVLIALATFLTLMLTANVSLISTSSSSQQIDHVILIMMENKNYQDLVGSSSAPYINSLVSEYAVATNFYGIEYPSLPNYIDISSGSNGGITSDCTNGPSSGGCETSNTNIFSLLQSNGQSWMAYEESMPSNCYTSDSGNLNSGGYIVHHDPIPYFTDLSSVCSQNDVPLGNVGSETGAFFNALNGNSLPSFSFVTPNSCDDMHSCGISSGDSWLSEIIPDIINSPSYSSTITIITWDTGNCVSPCNQNKDGGGQVLTIIVGPPTLVNYGNYGTFYNHYSTLATIETIFGLGNLGRNDASATPMTAMLNLNGGGTSSTTTSSSSQDTTISATTASSSTSSSTTITSPTTTTNTTTVTSSSINSSESISNDTSSTSFSSITSDSISRSITQTSLQSNQALTASNSISANSTGGSSSSSAVVVGSNAPVGTLSALSPARDPPAAYGIGIYEIPLVGTLGYLLLNVRRGPKSWTLPAQNPSGGRREYFWTNKSIRSNTRPELRNGKANSIAPATRRLFWKMRKRQ